MAEKMGFKACLRVSGQTYARKLDTIVCNCLGLIAQSCCKFSNDLRLLQNLKEIEEPFGEEPDRFLPPWLISAIPCAVDRFYLSAM